MTDVDPSKGSRVLASNVSLGGSMLETTHTFDFTTCFGRRGTRCCQQRANCSRRELGVCREVPNMLSRWALSDNCLCVFPLFQSQLRFMHDHIAHEETTTSRQFLAYNELSNSLPQLLSASILFRDVATTSSPNIRKIYIQSRAHSTNTSSFFSLSP